MMRFIGYFALVAGLTGVSCSSSPTLAGGAGTETTNAKVTGVGMCSDGLPALNATVRLRRSDYVTAVPTLAKSAIYGADALTDSSGRFEITGIDPGSYRIEISNGQSAVLLACSLDVGAIVDFGIDMLRAFATITGTVDTTGRAGQQLYVQVKGLERLVAADVAGKFVLSNMPTGSFTVRAVTADDSAIAEASGISVAPGVNTSVTMLSGWGFSKRLYLNTTATGANVSEVVFGFPLLVRLDATSFDFSQARDSGQDIRFTKPDGTPLPFEIEQWDGTAKVAAIWVLMDTVRGNDSTQSLVMAWGNPAAASQSNGAAVFDTADGYAGVWHLSEGAAGTGAAAVYRDATGNAFHGADNISSTDHSGVIGAGQRLNSASGDFVDLGINRDFLSGVRQVTLEAWVKVAPGDSAGMVITHSIDDQRNTTLSYAYIMVDQDHYLLAGGRTSSGDSVPEHIVVADEALTVGSWHHVAASCLYGNDSMYLYMDGVMISAMAAPFAESQTAGTVSTSSFIGRQEGIGENFYNGWLDEVRTHRVARSAAWIKLSFENQRADQKVVISR